MIKAKVIGLEELKKNCTAIEVAMVEAAPKALETGAGIAIAMMKRLVPVDTGKLRNSIRFTLGFGQGNVKVVSAGRNKGKAIVVGYIVAGDRTTEVSSPNAPPTRKGRKGTKRYQNALLQEFGTVKMKAHPYFFPSWRVRKTEVRRKIASELNRALKAANKQQPPAAAA